MSQSYSEQIFTKIPCVISGQLVWDTDRERIKQHLAKFLLDNKGYIVSDLQVDREIHFRLDEQKIVAIADLVVHIQGKSLMVLRGGPGSVVTREAGTISAARLLEPDYIVPYAVQANLHDASFLDVRTKKAIRLGYDNIPARSELLQMTEGLEPVALPEKRRSFEEQILYSYDTHG